MGCCFIMQWFPLEIVALAGLAVLALTGIISPGDVFTGFSSPPVVSIICTLVIAESFKNTGITDIIARYIFRYTQYSVRGNIVAVLIVTSLFSSFINNAPVTILLLPTVLSLAAFSKISPSKLLIPLSFGSLLGGMNTAIGCVPNLLANEILAKAGQVKFAFWEFTPFGALQTALGVLFFYFFGDKLLPATVPYERIQKSKEQKQYKSIYKLNDKLFSVSVPLSAPLLGKKIKEVEMRNRFHLDILEIKTNGQQSTISSADYIFKAHDELLVQGEASAVHQFQKFLGTEETETMIVKKEIASFEVVLAPRSTLAGYSLSEIRFQNRYGVNVIGVYRNGEPITSDLNTLKLEYGDTLLLHGTRERAKQLMNEPELIMVTDFSELLDNKDKKIASVLGFLFFIGLSLSGLFAIEICAFFGAIFNILCKTVTVEDFFKKIDWRVIILIAVLIPLGNAMEETGVFTSLSESFTPIGKASGMMGQSIVLVYTLFFLVASSLVSQFFDNTFAVIFLAPLAISFSRTYGLNVHASVMAVTLGASLCFLSPYSHRANLLIVSQGGYKTYDFFCSGLWLTLICVSANLVLLIFYYY
jgi:di/tricarboxylate transporter